MENDSKTKAIEMAEERLFIADNLRNLLYGEYKKGYKEGAIGAIEAAIKTLDESPIQFTYPEIIYFLKNVLKERLFLTESNNGN